MTKANVFVYALIPVLLMCTMPIKADEEFKRAFILASVALSASGLIGYFVGYSKGHSQAIKDLKSTHLCFDSDHKNINTQDIHEQTI